MMHALALPLLLLAAQPRELNCEDAVTQADMNECAAREFIAADVDLNAAWGEFLQAARQGDAEAPPRGDDRPGAEARMRRAQRAWVTFRDEHCAVAGYEARGGSMESMLVDGCRAELTRARSRQLRELIGGGGD
jgi:uncharacterized protein YecT (DUF1311 family)